MWRGSTDIRWRTLHRVVGAVAGPVLLVTALTGILMVWKEPLRGLVGAEGKPTPAVAEQAGRPLAPLDDLVARARADFGGTPLRQIRFSSGGRVVAVYLDRSEEHTSELQSLMRIPYAVFCLQKKNQDK